MEAVIARGLHILAALGGAYLVALWFVLVVWTFRDIETRSKNVLTHVFSTLLVVLFFVPGVILYMILRPKETLDAAFQRSLEEEYLLQDLEELPVCRSCQHYVEDDFMICPNCQTRLRDACVACTRLVDLRWTVCPYCGSEQSRSKEEPRERVPETAARWVAPTVLRRRVLRELPSAVPSDSIAARGVEPPAVAALASSSTPLPPVRLFDRRKTRESARLNGYRRPTVVSGRTAVTDGAPLVDRFGRTLDHGIDGVAVNGQSIPVTGNGRPTESSEAVARVHLPIGSEEAGD